MNLELAMVSLRNDTKARQMALDRLNFTHRSPAMEEWEKMVREVAKKLHPPKPRKPRLATQDVTDDNADGIARLNERDARNEYHTFQQAYLGDPSFERSALGQKVAALFET